MQLTQVKDTRDLKLSCPAAESLAGSSTTSLPHPHQHLPSQGPKFDIGSPRVSYSPHCSPDFGSGTQKLVQALCSRASQLFLFMHRVC